MAAVERERERDRERGGAEVDAIESLPLESIDSGPTARRCELGWENLDCIR